MEWFAVPFTLSLGITGLVVGILFRVGKARGVARYHRNDVYPIYVRNIGFGMIPAGVSLVLFSVAILFFELKLDRIAVGITAAAWLAAAVSVLLVVAPPRWIFPNWMNSGTGTL
jgi:hypothetical protein